MNRLQRRIHLLAWLILGPLAVAGVLIATSHRPPLPSGPIAAESSP